MGSFGRSVSDRLKPIQDKMQEYLHNSVRLGFLLNPQDKSIEIYRQGQPVEVLQSPITVFGEDVLPSFVLSLHKVFSEA
jgi:Uma2 family endonuclease